MMKFYSQCGQDKWAYENLFKNKNDGFFIEIGADDGIHFSNTKFFEDLGWNGICIEPSPIRFAELRKNRKCILENVAISDSIETVDFLDISGYGRGLSGIIKNYDPRHIERINTKAKNHPDYKGCKTVQVPCATLNSIFEKHNIVKADFCTIDTEGSELQILKSLDFNKFEINAIFVENNYKEQRVANYLGNQGYDFFQKVAMDDVYLKRR